ncbi:MAG: hypothetical protein HAW63_00665 [Bdellovibrionaceae bacterium]|nr:hypothetical protein [Pseudobdellovibrionaceae bacterium]
MIREIHLSSAFSLGANIWVSPHDNGTSVIKQLDYFTQFQLSKNSNKPLFMLYNHRLLPCTAIMQVHYKPSEKVAWIKNIFTVWEKQNKESLRIFLPKDFDAQLCKKYLTEIFPDSADISLVSED